MNFFADLHIHSRFSRATSKDLSLPNLDAWARLKGLKVLATGDFTHPVWRKELKDSLKLDEKSGFYQLLGKPEQLKILPENSKLLHGEGPLYCLEAEISSIYKKNGRVRKIHNLIFVPTLEDADRLAARLEKIGNLSADGRPILGLDAHDLLEILLETVPRGVLIPAHIWTPWFSLFGSKSGFDSLAECFGDLKNEIFALETGLSSNPFMNRCLSSLDQYVLIANSDAHSGAKLAREVNVFGGEPSYDGLFNALRASAKRESGQKQLPCYFESTIEFFPEEGKYHLDGHRQCQVSLVPTASQKCADLCPVCHKPLTIGVLHRVMELADRPNPARLPLEPPFLSVMPLLELTCEIMGLATITERVQKQYVQILEHFGPELQVLTKSPLSELEKYWPALALACERLRSGKVTLEGGYDGVFGKVHLFKEGELENHKQKNFKSQSQKEQTEQNLLEPSIAAKQLAKLKDFKAQVKQEPKAEPKKTSYSEEQLLAINHNLGPALVLAGPGSGKTHLLLGRVQKLLHDGLAPHEILIITFTRQAAKELKTRLEKNLGPNSSAITCQTLHAFCFERCLKDLPQSSILPEETALSIFMEANLELTSKKGRDLWAKITKLREECSLDDPSQASLYKLYDKYQNYKIKALQINSFDFTEILEEAYQRLPRQAENFKAVLVDEIQDCSLLNLKVIATLVKKNGQGFFGIGDPDQSIYAFRGAVRDVTATLRSFWPNLSLYHLSQSFRQSAQILNVAQNLLKEPQCGKLSSACKMSAKCIYLRSKTNNSENAWIASQIAALLGPSSHTLSDGKTSPLSLTLAPRDIAILVRLRRQLEPIALALEKKGIPVNLPTTPKFYADLEIENLINWLATQKLADLPKPNRLGVFLEQQNLGFYEAGPNSPFRQFINFFEECGSYENFFTKLAWLKKEEELLAKTDTVKLLTMHAAKGLEFTAVFLPAFEEGIMPLQEGLFKKEGKKGRIKGEGEKEETGPRTELGPNSAKNIEDHRQREEERRLLYVAITRASQLIFVSSAESRLIFGQKVSLPESSFLPTIEALFEHKVIRQNTKVLREQKSLI